VRADALILGGWTLLVAVEAFVALLFEPLPALLLGWATLIGGALFAYVWLRRPAPGAGTGAEARFVVDVSPQTVLLAVGVAALITSVYAGYWLALVGGGMVALAAWNLRREGR
jgi:hypothetical protein